MSGWGGGSWRVPGGSDRVPVVPVQSQSTGFLWMGMVTKVPRQSSLTSFGWFPLYLSIVRYRRTLT